MFNLQTHSSLHPVSIMFVFVFIITITCLHQELEKLASRKLRINAKETMKVAERLYTQGYISYPRTETNMFPKDLDLTALITEQTRDPNWGGLSENCAANFDCVQGLWK